MVDNISLLSELMQKLIHIRLKEQQTYPSEHTNITLY